MKIMKTKLRSMILSLLCVMGMSVESGWGMTTPIKTLKDQVAKKKPVLTSFSSASEETLANTIAYINEVNSLVANINKAKALEILNGYKDTTNESTKIATPIKTLKDQVAKKKPVLTSFSNASKETLANTIAYINEVNSLAANIKKAKALEILNNYKIAKAQTTPPPSQQTQPAQNNQPAQGGGATADLIPGKLTADNFKTELATYLNQLKNNPQATSDVNPVLTIMKSLKDIKSADFKGHNQNYLEALSSLAKSDSELFNKLVPIKIKRGTQEISVLADQDDQGRTVLHYAAEAGDVELVKQILQAAKNLG